MKAAVGPLCSRDLACTAACSAARHARSRLPDTPCVRVQATSET